MNIPTSPPWNEQHAQDLAYMHVGHKIKITDGADHVLSGTLEELHITRERYEHQGEIKREPALVGVVVSFGDAMTRLDLRANDKVSIKP